jgi:hypothetical protein
LEKLLPSGEREMVSLPAADGQPLEGLLRRERREAVERAIALLPPRFRLPLVLKDLVEFSLAEVAEVLGLKEATVKTRLHRARLRLARELARELPRRPAPPPDHGRRVCLDLLRAKQEAMDRQAAFPLANAELCERCRALFSTLDLGREICRRLAGDELPSDLRRTLEKELGMSSPGSAKPGRKRGRSGKAR